MGSSFYYHLPPCNNCGKPGGAIMTSGKYGHSHACCGDACATRLQHKIKHGMGAPHGHEAIPWFQGWADDGERISAMRNRIKQLANRLKHKDSK